MGDDHGKAGGGEEIEHRQDGADLLHTDAELRAGEGFPKVHTEGHGRTSSSVRCR